MRVAIVGGLTRATRDWEAAGDAAGIVVEHHDGNTSGNRATTLARMIGRADVVIAITIPNSHAGVAIARRAAHSRGCPFVLVKRLAPQALADIVANASASGASSGPLPSGMERSAKPASRVRIPEGAATPSSPSTKRAS